MQFDGAGPTLHANNVGDDDGWRSRMTINIFLVVTTSKRGVLECL